MLAVKYLTCHSGFCPQGDAVALSTAAEMSGKEKPASRGTLKAGTENLAFGGLAIMVPLEL
jgi:hypothetical protein